MIEKALEGARAVVVLWSSKSVASRWVRAEATLADRAGKLVPAMIEPCKKPIMFELKQTADLSGWTGDSNDTRWQEFLVGVRRFVEKNGPAVSAASIANQLRADLENLRSQPGATIAQHPALARRRALWLSIGAASVVAAVVAGTMIYDRRPATLTDKDTIVLADFANTTGDPVFDDTLRQGLAAQLQQSPFLSVVSDDRIRRTLALMEQPADTPLTPEIAQACVCPNGERGRALWIDQQPRQSVRARSARDELLDRRHPRRRASASGAQGGCPRRAE